MPSDKITAGRIVVVIENLRLANESNAREHWAAKAKRAKSQRESVFYTLKSYIAPPAPVIVTLTRISPRPFDSDDGLNISFKAIRDEVANWLLPHNRANQSKTWADDSDGQITWRYGWRKGEPKTHSVEIVIETIKET